MGVAHAGRRRPDREETFSHPDEGDVTVGIFDGDDGPERLVAERDRCWDLAVEDEWVLVEGRPSDIPPWLEAVTRRLGLRGVRTA